MGGEHEHWQRVYGERAPEEVSWFEGAPGRSLAAIAATGVGKDAAIVDVGGGASRLAGELLAAGYNDLTVADISEQALAEARGRLGEAAERIAWVEADVRTHDFGRRFDVWHDRAVFHFMVDDADVAAYLETLAESLSPGGHLVIATFGPQGPEQCSGLPVSRYGPQELAARLGARFEPLGSELVLHRTPSGNEQQFLYARFRHIPV